MSLWIPSASVCLTPVDNTNFCIAEPTNSSTFSVCKNRMWTFSIDLANFSKINIPSHECSTRHFNTHNFGKYRPKVAFFVKWQSHYHHMCKWLKIFPKNEQSFSINWLKFPFIDQLTLKYKFNTFNIFFIIEISKSRSIMINIQPHDWMSYKFTVPLMTNYYAIFMKYALYTSDISDSFALNLKIVFMSFLCRFGFFRRILLAQLHFC